MQFDANRLARLAGLGRAGQTIITESVNTGVNENDGQALEEEALEEEAEQGTPGTAHVDEPGRGQGKYLDEVLEIDEVSIKKEIMAMKQERLAENRLRDVIRHELSDILEASGYEMDGSWVYGDDKPTRSKKGQVTLGTLGLGFK